MLLKDVRRFITKSLSWLLFTKKCRYCGKIVKANEYLCNECAENLPVIKGEKCKYCGVEKSRCDCKKHKLGFDGITAPFYYENGIRSCIHQLKFDNKPYLATMLAKNMAKSVREDFVDKNFDFISYVPFSKAQTINRNYNQSELLAESLSKELNIPLENVMVKCFETKAQHTMSIRQRKGNVFGVFDVKTSADVTDKTILLVDDVKTTGSTLDDCAWILKIRGAKEVYCVTASIASYKKENKTEKKEKTKDEI